MIAEKENESASLLTIQEMARQSGLSEHTLRNYERIGLITPVERDPSSGHRRYTQDDAAIVENLACLRGTGMPIADIREFLRLRALGRAAAAQQKALFKSHYETVCREIEMMQVRQTYLAGKVAFWEAVDAGDMELADSLMQKNKQLATKLVSKKETL